MGIGRMIHLIFALLMMLYLIFGHEIHIFTEDVPPFQTAMFVTYLVLVVLWAIPLRMLLKEIDTASCILPSSNHLYDASSSRYRQRAVAMEEHEVYQEIMRHYEGIIIEPVASKYCQRQFGDDIATIIMMYFGCGADLIDDLNINLKPKET